MPTVAVDAFRTPSTRPQRIDVASWTVWSLRSVRFEADPSAVSTTDLVIAVGTVGTVTTGEVPAETMRRMIEEEPGPAGNPTATGLQIVARVLGDVLDDVARVIAELDDAVEEIEAAVFTPERVSHAARIYRLKREVQTVRRSVGPLPELFAPEDRYDSEVESVMDVRVLAELAARARRLVEQLSHVDDLLDSVLTAHLTQVAIQQNDDMRRISAWVAIVAVPTAIASIYGMNFTVMPELGWRYGYPLVLVSMVAVATGLYRLFRRSGWL